MIGVEPWLRVSLLLCLFGFLKEFRPSEPYVTHYLVGPWKNFTSDQVNQDIYPVGTYCYLSLLVVVFLVTDVLRYKLVIVLLGAAGVVTFCTLLLGESLLAMQVVQFFYGLFSAAEVAYYTYIYAQVDRSHYQQVTSHTRTAYLLGRTVSGVVSQAAVSSGALDYQQLIYLTLAGMVAATLWSLVLPPVRHSLYFHREDGGPVPESLDNSVPELLDGSALTSKNSPRGRWAGACSLLWRDFVAAFSQWYVLKWSLWWALAMCGYLQGLNYVQLLWEVILNDTGQSNSRLLNGAVEAAYTIIGAAAALGCAWVRLDWRSVGELVLGACSLGIGSTLAVAAVCRAMWVAYLCHVLFGVLFNAMITIANAEVAKNIKEDSYGLIFGVNTFLALALQSVLTVVVAGKGGLELPPRTQFVVYGSYFGALGVVFLLMYVCTLCSKARTAGVVLCDEEP
ncbi:thiamine transporter 1-like [Bacillus rossius redtenbacheri]|uniref:thiamine transporter 1-like n=1 Tax=Bacillus rossius redtenbacheri TaxID=93214 RepID=UPI002FDD7F84